MYSKTRTIMPATMSQILAIIWSLSLFTGVFILGLYRVNQSDPPNKNHADRNFGIILSLN
jgi:hypothetical protein